MTRRHVVHHIISRGLPGQDGRSMALVSETEPTGEDVGEVWYNPTGEGELSVWTGSSWDELKGEVPQSVLDDIDDLKNRTGSDDRILANAAPYNVTENDTSGLQQWADDVSSSGKVGVILPGDYEITESIVVGSNSHFRLYGVTLRNNVPEITGYTFRLRYCDNVTIEGVNIDGQRDLWNEAEWGHTEWRHGIMLQGATNVVLRNIVSNNNRGDGVGLGVPGSNVTPSDFVNNTEHVVMENVICHNNFRQGMSITGARHGTYIRCNFTGTNGTDPEAGLDVERDVMTTYTDDHHFYDCTFSGNNGGGILLSGGDPNDPNSQNITFTNCTIEDNHYVGVQFNTGLRYRFTNCRILGTKEWLYGSVTYGNGIWMYRPVNDVVIEGGEIAGNLGRGFSTVGSSGGGGKGLIIRGVNFHHNQESAVDLLTAPGALVEANRFHNTIANNAVQVRQGSDWLRLVFNTFEDKGAAINSTWTPNVYQAGNVGP